MAAQNPIDEVRLPLVLTPDPFTYFLGGALAFIFWQPMIVTIALGHWDWKMFAFSFGMTAGFFLLIHGCRIVIDEKGLAHKRLFVWSRFLPYEQMGGLKIEVGRNRSKPIYRLVIIPLTQSLEPLTINIKLFPRKGLSLLMKIVSAKAPTAHLDEQCEQMKERVMPSLFGDEKKMSSRSKIV